MFLRGPKAFSWVLAFLVFWVLVFWEKHGLSGTKGLCERGSFFDLVRDIRWEEIFPVSLGGVRTKGPSKLGFSPHQERAGGLVCVCRSGGKVRLGVVATYWQPVRAVETVKIPWCLPTFAKHIDLGNYWHLMGVQADQKSADNTFSSSHMLKFNLLDVLNIFLDVPCVPHEGLDIAYFSELDPTWNNSVIAQFMHPEAILFANPVAKMACIADSATSIAGWPLDPLFWCAGGWGSVYPFVGFSESSTYIKGNVLNMGKLLYRETRLGVSWDTAINECGAVITPIWVKSHYKFHQLKPVRGPILKIGEPTILWDHAKNPPGGTSKGGADNFSWVIFKLVRCCMGKSN